MKTFEEYLAEKYPYVEFTKDFAYMMGVNEMAQHEREQCKLAVEHILAVAEEKSTDVVMHCFVDGKEPERWVKLSDLRNYIHGKQEA